MPAGADPERWARDQALTACVWGAPAWFASSSVGGVGAVNLNRCAAIAVWQDQEEGHYEIVAIDGGGGWQLDLGPYLDEAEAGMVAQQVIRLSADVAGWPAVERELAQWAGGLPADDVRVEVLRNGAGAPATVRVVHLPTGVVATSSDRGSLTADRDAAVDAMHAAVAALGGPRQWPAVAGE